MEGTLSLFDWRPAPPAQDPPRPNLGSIPAAPAQRIIVFDCETTGIDFAKDQVIELCVQHGLDDDGAQPDLADQAGGGDRPGRAGDPRHLDGRARGLPGVRRVRRRDRAVFADADVIVGYNLSFDIDMLQAEYARLGRPLLDLSGKQIVDAFRLWQQCEPRSLQHAHRRFVGDEFAAAHSASADVAATGRVLVGMLRAFELDGRDWGQIATVCDPSGRGGELGRAVAPPALGRRRRARVRQVRRRCGARARRRTRPQLPALGHREGFPAHVAEICRAALERTGDEFLTWVRSRYGQPAPTAQPPFLK